MFCDICAAELAADARVFVVVELHVESAKIKNY